MSEVMRRTKAALAHLCRRAGVAWQSLKTLRFQKKKRSLSPLLRSTAPPLCLLSSSRTSRPFASSSCLSSRETSRLRIRKFQLLVRAQTTTKLMSLRSQEQKARVTEQDTLTATRRPLPRPNPNNSSSSSSTHHSLILLAPRQLQQLLLA